MGPFIGAPISKEDQVVTLLGSLPQSYSTLVTALEAHTDDDLKLAHVQQVPIHKEMKITEKFVQKTGMPATEPFSSAMIGTQGDYKFWKPRCYVVVNRAISYMIILKERNTVALTNNRLELSEIIRIFY